jgi:hypothetical protein
LENLEKPFQTITTAINTIQIRSPERTRLSSWNVVIRPGNYKENVTVQNWINLAGTLQGTRIFGTVTVVGNSSIMDLSIESNTTPVVDARIPSGIDDATVSLDNVAIDVSGANLPHSRIVVVTQSDALNSRVSIDDSTISADFSSVESGTNTLVQPNDTEICIVDTDLSVRSASNSEVIVFDSNASGGLISGGSSNIMIGPNVPSQPITFFQSASGLIDIIGHTSLIIEAIVLQSDDGVENITTDRERISRNVEEAKKNARNTVHRVANTPERNPQASNQRPDVTYLKATNVGFLWAASNILDLQSVFPLNRVLANVIGPGAQVTALDIATRFTFVPQIKGNVENIQYFALSEGGNLVSSGGLYTNIVTINANLFPNGYFPQDNDYTILVEDPVTQVMLEDPSVVSQEVLFKGKIVVITNLSSTDNVTVTGGPIRPNGNVTIEPLRTVTFQNDGRFWYEQR